MMVSVPINADAAIKMITTLLVKLSQKGVITPEELHEVLSSADPRGDETDS